MECSNPVFPNLPITPGTIYKGLDGCTNDNHSSYFSISTAIVSAKLVTGSLKTVPSAIHKGLGECTLDDHTTMTSTTTSTELMAEIPKTQSASNIIIKATGIIPSVGDQCSTYPMDSDTEKFVMS